METSVNIQRWNTEELPEARAQGVGVAGPPLGQGWGAGGRKDGWWEGRLLVSVVRLVPDFLNYLRILL